MNSSLCIQSDQVCDRIINCSFQDDELICVWLFKSNSPTFYCQNSPSRQVVTCENRYKSQLNNPYCQMREHLWFWDLQPQPRNLKQSFAMEFEPYPGINENINSISFHSLVSNPEKQTLSLIDTILWMLKVNNDIDQ